MSKIDLERYKSACDYPGYIDEAAVERNLRDYIRALGVDRKIVELKRGWTLNEYPSLKRYTNRVLDYFISRSTIDAIAAIDAINAIAARDAIAARAARAAGAAIDARDAGAAGAAIDAIAAIAAINARAVEKEDAMKNLLCWCIQNCLRWRSDLSWLVVIFLGANQLRIKEVKKWSQPLFEAFCAGAWLLHWTDDTLFWVAKPTIHKDAQNRLHHDSHAAVISNLEDIYFWHGVFVQKSVICNPESITLQGIQSEKNAEVRRVLIERFGEVRYLEESGLEPIASDEKFGTIYTEIFNAGRPICRLRVVNRSPESDGSYKTYWLPINPGLYGGDAGRIPQAAAASTWRTTPGGKELLFECWKDYNPIIET